MTLVDEEKARATSTRTKAALVTAKVRGIRLGNPRLQPDDAETANWTDQAGKRKSTGHQAAAAFHKAAASDGRHLATRQNARLSPPKNPRLVPN